MLAGAARAECVVVGYERVHAIHGDELFGERVGHVEVVRFRTDDPAHDLAVADVANEPVDPFAQDAPPVCTHPDLQRRVSQDRGRPLNGVDLGEKRRVHEAGPVEEVIVRPGRVLRLQAIANGIVLAGKQ